MLFKKFELFGFNFTIDFGSCNGYREENMKGLAIMAKKIVGNCTLCGKKKELTFEHIPPKSSGNNVRVQLYSIEDIITKNTALWDVEGLKYTLQQKGTGKDSLCESCNNDTGTWYGKGYIDLSNAFGKFILENDVKSMEGFVLEGVKFKPLEFLKQVLSFFTSVQGTPLSDEISNFILEKEATLEDLGGFRVFMYLNVGSIHKQLGPFGKIDLSTGKSMVISEILSFPFGFNLYYPNEDREPKIGVEITDFCKYPYGIEQTATELEIISLESNNVFPLDFRPKTDFLSEGDNCD